MSASRTSEARARKLENRSGFSVPPGPSIREHILADLDKAMERYLDLKDEGSGDREVALVRGEIKGLARTVGRFGWSGVSFYYPVKGMKAAEQQSLARVKAARKERQ